MSEKEKIRMTTAGIERVENNFEDKSFFAYLVKKDEKLDQKLIMWNKVARDYTKKDLSLYDTTIMALNFAMDKLMEIKKE